MLAGECRAPCGYRKHHRHQFFIGPRCSAVLLFSGSRGKSGPRGARSAPRGARSIMGPCLMSWSLPVRSRSPQSKILLAPSRRLLQDPGFHSCCCFQFLGLLRPNKQRSDEVSQSLLSHSPLPPANCKRPERRRIGRSRVKRPEDPNFGQHGSN